MDNKIIKICLDNEITIKNGNFYKEEIETNYFTVKYLFDKCTLNQILDSYYAFEKKNLNSFIISQFNNGYKPCRK